MAMASETAMADRLTVWQCIGCGRLEAPQPCIGVCQDRKVELVDARAYDRLAMQAQRTHRQAQAFQNLLRRLAWTTPREGAWDRSYRNLQQQARTLLLEFASDVKEICRAE
jgi:hypothetical protein